VVGEGLDEAGFLRPFCDQVSGWGVGVVFELEAGAYGAAEESEGGGIGGREDEGALPGAAGDDELRGLAGGEVGAEDGAGRCAVGEELEEFDGSTEVVVEDLVALQQVHLGEGVRFEEIVDGCGGSARVAVARVGEGCGREEFGGFPGTNEPAAFTRMRLEVEEVFDVFGSKGRHDEVSQAILNAPTIFIATSSMRSCRTHAQPS
jgi:hypothetical protein